MEWEKRGNGIYYYRKRRKGSRVTSEYIGSGMAGYICSELDKEEQMERAHKREQLKSIKRGLEILRRDLDQQKILVNSLTRASLLLIGYHPHKGQWRKARNV
jgi:hypothetical protein